MNNLAHIYFFEPNVGFKGYDEIIDLLIKSINLKFFPSRNIKLSRKKQFKFEIEAHKSMDNYAVIILASTIFFYIKMNELKTSRYYEVD